MKAYDIAIIGGGPGGYVAAIRAAQLKKSVVLFEKTAIGGTCLNCGCIPTKTMLHDAELLAQVQKAGQRGIKVEKAEVEMQAVVSNKNTVVKRLTSGVAMLLKANGVEVVYEKAQVLDAGRLLAGGQEYSFGSLIIATGSSNFVPPVPGFDLDGILSSTELLNIDHVPESLIIVGGGVIGCEFASVFSHFGTKVTIIEMLPRLLSVLDEDITTMLERSFRSTGVEVLTSSRVVGVKRTEREMQVSAFSGEKDIVLEAEQVLVSTGRKANLEGLEELGLLLTDKKYIQVDEQMRTNVPNVYAIGDVTGIIQLAHVASAQGCVAAESAAGLSAKMDYSAVPNCVFTLPEIGCVGLTEAEARERCGEVAVGKVPLAAIGKALAIGEPDGFIKLIADKKTGRVLGGHIIGAGSADMVAPVTQAMSLGGTLEDIIHTIYAHPTLSEAVHEAAHMAVGCPIHMPPVRT